MSNSTWREQRLTVKANSVKVANFIDTKPNYLYFANNSALQLYVSVSSNVSNSVFDMIVPAYATKKYARPEGMTEIYIANVDLVTDINCSLISFEQVFNSQDLPQTQEMVGASASGLLGIIEVSGITESLPAGINNIGKVTVETLPAVNLAPLPVGANVIGKIIVTEISTGTNTIGKVDMNIPKFIGVKITLVAGVDYSVKAGAGYFAKIKTALTDVILKNNTTILFEGLGNDEFSQPIYCDSSIKLNSVAGGIVYVSYL